MSRLRFLTAGESHGPALAVIIEGLPAGLDLTGADINRDLARRQIGYGRGGRMAIEQDRAEILSGIRKGLTLGSPIALVIRNRDWENWRENMAAEPGPPAEPVTCPRPGHADLAGLVKYGFSDIRNVLERASARETAARVAAGAAARKLLAALSINIYSRVVRIGSVTDRSRFNPPDDYERIEASRLRCRSVSAENRMAELIDRVKARGESLGGIFEITVTGLPVGLGSYVHWDRRLDGRLAQALASIPAIKGVEIGAGFQAAARSGSRVQDEIFHDPGRGYFRKSNRAGGLEGGLTNGEPL
ncbi:MAG TPA: chorismate synthase, partial [bacterium]|nr:chorismate synthase [bacterium]